MSTTLRPLWKTWPDQLFLSSRQKAWRACSSQQDLLFQFLFFFFHWTLFAWERRGKKRNLTYTVRLKRVREPRDVLALRPSSSSSVYERVVEQGLTLTSNCAHKVTCWNGAARLWAKRLNEVEPKVMPRCLILGLLVSYWVKSLRMKWANHRIFQRE